jgi:NTP pyrophosphatase (non-canonical NTP hydrolase)
VSFKVEANFIQYPYNNLNKEAVMNMNEQTNLDNTEAGLIEAISVPTNIAIDMNRFSKFVMGVTSVESRSMGDFIARAAQLHYTSKHLNVSLLLTSLIGLTSEAGEAQEIVKKVLFQGKPYTDETREHLKKELGDVIWYWANACNALQLDPNEVVAQNVEKLKSRYPGGKFDAFYSENRKEGDL